MVKVVKEMVESDFISGHEVANMLGVKYKTVTMWALRGTCPFPTYKIGGSRKYRRSEVLKYLESTKTCGNSN